VDINPYQIELEEEKVAYHYTMFGKPIFLNENL
jgi:hypothetical protein